MFNVVQKNIYRLREITLDITQTHLLKFIKILNATF